MIKKILVLIVLLFIPLVIHAENIEKSIVINGTDSTININDYFDLSSNENIWMVEDPSIANIVNNEIVPLKTGTTKIYTSINNDHYTLNIEIVTEKKNLSNKTINQVMEDVDVKNPKTTDFLLLLVMIVVLSLATAIFLTYNMRHNKFEDL